MKTVGTKKTDTKRTVLSIIIFCLWVIVSVIAVQFAVGFILLFLIGKTKFNQPVWTAVYSAISYVLAMALIILVPIMFQKKKPSKKELCNDLGIKDLPTWTDIGLAPVGFVVSTLLAAGLVSLFTVFPWFNAEEAQNVGFSLYMNSGDRVVAFLTLVVIAPIAEEIIFRGWLYGNLRNKLNDKIPEKWGIVLSTLIVSVVFGFIHLQWNVGVNVFALSVVLCVLREVTGTIYAGILTHMIKNGVAFFLLYVLGIA